MAQVTDRYRELLRRYFLPQWRAALALLLLLLVATGVQLVQPRLLARFIDMAAAGAPLAALGRIAVSFLVLATAGSGVAVVQAYLGEHVALIATNRVRSDLLLHCLRLDMSFHHEHLPGELIQRLDGDVAALANFFSRFLVTLLGNGLLLTGVLVMVATIEWRLGAALAGFAGLVLVGLYRLRFVASPFWQRLMQARAERSAFLEEHLSATEDIRASGATAYVMRRFFEHERDVLRRRMWATFAGDATFGSAGGFLFALGTAVGLAVAAWLFVQGAVSIGTVFLIFVYTQMLATPIQVINRQVQDLQTATAAIERIYALLQTRSAIVDGAGAELPDGPLRVEVADAAFGYGAAESVLGGVSVRLEPGRVLGVLGPTGSGKTTLARLLLRFYDPRAGVVRIGDADLRETRRADLRERIGLVSQEVQLFHASVRDNVTFFDPGVPDERIIAVLSDLGLGEWLDGLPGGLDTPVTSGGTGLSAGEAQLLAFARVFLRDPGLVILDEATSRLDPASEQRLEQAVARLFAGRTAIVIAHRLRTILLADEIVILDEGHIVEYGPRPTLAADPHSRFARLLRAGGEGVPGEV